VPNVIDPRRQVDANLERLRVEHQPGIDEAKRAVDAAPDKAARAVAKQELKDRRRAYKQACREAKAILKAPIAW
jgi:hypothetical protein